MKLVRRYTPEYSTNRDFDVELVCSGHKLNSHRYSSYLEKYC